MTTKPDSREQVAERDPRLVPALCSRSKSPSVKRPSSQTTSITRL